METFALICLAIVAALIVILLFVIPAGLLIRALTSIFSGLLNGWRAR